jgi:hypothetical protein
MSTIEILNLALGLGFAGLGWFAKTMWLAIRDLTEDLTTLKDSLHNNYVRKDDFREFRHELLGFLQRIENKLDGKQDK